MAASQRAEASLREGFAFRSGRLAPAAAQRQRPALFVLLRKGGNASLKAVNKAFLCAKTAEEKTLQTLSVNQLILH